MLSIEISSIRLISQHSRLSDVEWAIYKKINGITIMLCCIYLKDLYMVVLKCDNVHGTW